MTHIFPDKFYYKISEVSEIIGVETYVLRFWENEFKGIRPKRTNTGQRLYRKKDIELLFEIKTLLHERKFTIDGARKHLENRKQKEKPSISLFEIKLELEKIKRILS